MNILSLFDGMSCCRIALERAGIHVENYYASEIDKHAIKVAQANWPTNIQLGDVTKWREWDIDWASIDLVTGGFPCQAWSMAGKQLGDKDERGMLFWTMLDVMKKVREHNPKAHFLIENVKMKKEFEQYITYHTEQALCEVYKILINSALVSAQNRQRYYWTSFPCTQPDDKRVVLADILESGVFDHKKSWCIDANYFKGENLKSYFEKNRRQLVFESRSIKSIKRAFTNVRFSDEKAVTLTTTPRQPASCGATNIIYKSDIGIMLRNLTPLECERLQTVLDNYTAHVSNTQRYKMLGNGWTVDVIVHLLNCMKHVL